MRIAVWNRRGLIAPIVGALGIAGSLLVFTPSARAEEPTGWTDTAELSLVATSGNSENTTFGFKNQLRRAWDRSSFQLDAGGIRVESKTFTRFAVGAPTSFNVVETSVTDVTAENYYLIGRYDRKITDRFFWFAGGGWDRNEFAGIKNRYNGFGGVGNVWVDTETVKFRTDYAISYTKQDDLIDVPGVSDDFVGVRVGWNYLHQFGANTTYVNDLIIDENLDETQDYRANMINSVAVAMNSRVALKVGLQWLYDNEPSFEGVTLFDVPGGTVLGTVPAQLDELDTVLTASLVVNF